MKTRIYPDLLGANSPREKKHIKGGKSDEKDNSGIELSTFPLTDLVYDVLRSIDGSYLLVKVMEAELVVLRSDRELLGKALSHCLLELINYSKEKGVSSMFGLRVYGKSGMGYIDIQCPDLDLSGLSIRTGKSALNLTGNVEPAFGFVIAQAALARVKSSYYINHNRLGGSNIVFEIPKVRGEAS